MERQKLKSILAMSVMCIVILIFMIIFVVITSNVNNRNNTSNNDWPWISDSSSKNETNPIYYNAMLIMFACSILLFSWINAILILCYKWETKWCKENKKLWGILSFIPPFFIMSLIFASKGISEYKKRTSYNKKGISYEIDKDGNIKKTNSQDKNEDELFNDNPFDDDYSSRQTHRSNSNTFDDDY